MLIQDAAKTLKPGWAANRCLICCYCLVLSNQYSGDTILSWSSTNTWTIMWLFHIHIAGHAIDSTRSMMRCSTIKQKADTCPVVTLCSGERAAVKMVDLLLKDV